MLGSPFTRLGRLENSVEISPVRRSLLWIVPASEVVWRFAVQNKLDILWFGGVVLSIFYVT